MQSALNDILRNNNSKILFAGVGNVLRSDDGVGVYIVSAIEDKLNISTLLVEVSIENYINKINLMAPDILVIADCIDFGKEPGYAGIVPVEEINEFNISSHNISLKRLSGFLKMKTWVMGIQPANLRVGENLTPVVRESAEKIIERINNSRG
ncbi:MAG TPA: hydrogenase maturation protease [Bacteroidales bacterium]|nr:hydrogenase maturation protease [Bacteroidales bacterium]